MSLYDTTSMDESAWLEPDAERRSAGIPDETDAAESADQWLNKAARYCAQAEHAEQEVRRKMAQWQVPSALHNTIIAYLRANGYIDDLRYCRALAHDKVAYNGWGRQKIRAALNALRLDEQAIEQALNDIDQNTYNRQLQRLIAQREAEPADKTLRFLMQRGFTYEEIKRIISQ